MSGRLRMRVLFMLAAQRCLLHLYHVAVHAALLCPHSSAAAPRRAARRGADLCRPGPHCADRSVHSRAAAAAPDSAMAEQPPPDAEHPLDEDISDGARAQVALLFRCVIRDPCVPCQRMRTCACARRQRAHGVAAVLHASYGYAVPRGRAAASAPHAAQTHTCLGIAPFSLTVPYPP
jgi:hypothetical protein